MKGFFLFLIYALEKYYVNASFFNFFGEDTTTFNNLGGKSVGLIEDLGIITETQDGHVLEGWITFDLGKFWEFSKNTFFICM